MINDKFISDMLWKYLIDIYQLFHYLCADNVCNRLINYIEHLCEFNHYFIQEDKFYDLIEIFYYVYSDKLWKLPNIKKYYTFGIFRMPLINEKNYLFVGQKLLEIATYIQNSDKERFILALLCEWKRKLVTSSQLTEQHTTLIIDNRWTGIRYKNSLKTTLFVQCLNKYDDFGFQTDTTLLKKRFIKGAGIYGNWFENYKDHLVYENLKASFCCAGGSILSCLTYNPKSHKDMDLFNDIDIFIYGSSQKHKLTLCKTLISIFSNILRHNGLRTFFTIENQIINIIGDNVYPMIQIIFSDKEIISAYEIISNFDMDYSQCWIDAKDYFSSFKCTPECVISLTDRVIRYNKECKSKISRIYKAVYKGFSLHTSAIQPNKYFTTNNFDNCEHVEENKNKMCNICFMKQIEKDDIIMNTLYKYYIPRKFDSYTKFNVITNTLNPCLTIISSDETQATLQISESIKEFSTNIKKIFYDENSTKNLKDIHYVDFSYVHVCST
jgi:hypothetical protein